MHKDPTQTRQAPRASIGIRGAYTICNKFNRAHAHSTFSFCITACSYSFSVQIHVVCCVECLLRQLRIDDGPGFCAQLSDQVQWPNFYVISVHTSKAHPVAECYMFLSSTLSVLCQHWGRLWPYPPSRLRNLLVTTPSSWKSYWHVLRILQETTRREKE